MTGVVTQTTPRTTASTRRKSQHTARAGEDATREVYLHARDVVHECHREDVCEHHVMVVWVMAGHAAINSFNCIACAWSKISNESSTAAYGSHNGHCHINRLHSMTSCSQLGCRERSHTREAKRLGEPRHSFSLSHTRQRMFWTTSGNHCDVACTLSPCRARM